MLHSSGLPKALWAEAVHHAASTGKKPDVRGLHEEGVGPGREGDKLGGHVREGHWIGVSEKRKGFRIYWPDTCSVTVERNVYTNKTSAGL
ncbi:hypothetical protein BDP27DRAFT_1329297, partial [Rhodocollybia butyracea]